MQPKKRGAQRGNGAPRVARWREWRFAHLDAQAPPLDTYPGGMPWYLDFYTNKSTALLDQSTVATLNLAILL